MATTLRSAWLAAVPLLVSLALTACGDGDDPRRATAELPPPIALPECPDAVYTSCDIRDVPCQKQLSELAACLRQSEPLEVPMDVLSEEAYRNLLQQDLASDEAASRPRFELALSLLGLASQLTDSPSARIEELVEKTGGFYVPTDKRIVIVDHGQPAASAETDAVLVHELVHSLQDADYDLTHWQEDARGSFDSALARSTLIEGEASFYQLRATIPLFGLDFRQVDLESALQARLAQRLEDALQAPSPVRQSFQTLPYGVGALQAFTAWQADGPRGIDARWSSPPLTMQGVLSELFGANQPQDTGIVLEQPAPDGLSLDSHDVLGAWCLYLLQARAGRARAVDAALSWRGDHLWVFTDAAQATYVLWQLEFESVDAALEWNGFFASLRGARHGTAGSRVYVSVGIRESATEPLEAWGKRWLDEPR